MATQTVEFLAVYGQTLTAKLYAVGSDTLVQTASAVAEQTNRIGVYRATFTDAAAGEYELHVATSGGIPVARWYTTLTLTTATFATYDGPAKLAAITHIGARIPSVTLVDTTTTNTDMRGTDGAALASAWTATRAGYMDSVLLAVNSNRTVQVTGSNHVAADIHELQPAVITAAAFAANWLTAAGTAADYITELQTAIGTATNQTTILDRQGYTLAVLAGTISDAQTAAETYAITLGANTFTVDFSGLDSSGNRTGQTLTKV